MADRQVYLEQEREAEERVKGVLQEMESAKQRDREVEAELLRREREAQARSRSIVSEGER